jgi:hypothetical protein
VGEETTEVEEGLTAEFANAEKFTLAGWYYFPDNAPATVDLFRLSQQGDKNVETVFRLAARDGVPFAEVVSFDTDASFVVDPANPKLPPLVKNLDVVVGGTAWPMDPSAWHFVAVTRNAGSLRIWLDGQLVGEGTSKYKYALTWSQRREITYGAVPMAWTAAYGEALDQEGLERVRSPGPRVWLSGSSAERVVSAAPFGASGPRGASGFTGPLDLFGSERSLANPGPTSGSGATAVIVAPNDYGGSCQYNPETKTCDPLVTYGGDGGVSLGRDGSMRFAKRWSGRIQVDAPPLQGMGAVFDVYFPAGTRGFYPGLVRDAPDHATPFLLPWDIRADFSCDGKACALDVFYQFDAGGSRKRFQVPIPADAWVRIGVGYDGKSRPQVAINGKLEKGKDLSSTQSIDQFSRASLQKEPRRRVRFGYDIREFWFTADAFYDAREFRLYGRTVSGIELIELTQSCAEAACDVGRRACVEGGALTTTVCTECTNDAYAVLESSPDYGARDILCREKQIFADSCVADVECASAACTNQQCSARTEAEALSLCDERYRNISQQDADRFTCGECKRYFESGVDSAPTDSCIWKPPYKGLDLIGVGNDGIHDPDNSPGFDTFACDSGHAVTTKERPFGVDPDIHYNEWQQSDPAYMLSTNPQFHHANVRLRPTNDERRTRCTPAMLTGCEDCRKSPAPSTCTPEFKKLCITDGCRACSEAGQSCNLDNGYPICVRCRPNYVSRRALMTPEACQSIYKSFHNWQSGHSSAWNANWPAKLFASPVPSMEDLKGMLQLITANDLQFLGLVFPAGIPGLDVPPDVVLLESKGVGAALAKSVQSLDKLRSDPAAYDRAYRALQDQANVFASTAPRVGDATSGASVDARSLAFYNCVRTSSVFWSAANDEICTAKRNPRGAPCPPINPDTKLPETGNGDEFCETNYCGRQLGLCTDGGDPRTETGQKSSNDRARGIDIAVFAVTQTNKAMFKVSGEGDDRTSTSSLVEKLDVEVLTLPIPIYNFTANIETRTGEKPSAPEASFTVLGIDVPEEADPVASCTGGRWENGSWEGSGECELNLDFELPKPTIKPKPLCKAVAEKIRKALKKSKIAEPIFFEKVFNLGPVPITVEGAPIVEPCVAVEAGFSEADLEAKLSFVSSFNTGYELQASAGFANFSAGVRATLTLLEVKLPVSWVMTVEQDSDPQTQEPLPRYSLVSRADISVELTLLGLTLSLFAEADFFLFSIEWELKLIELKAFELNQRIYGGPKREFVLDLGGK